MAKILTEGFFPDTMVACSPCEDTKPVTYKFNFVVTLPAFGKDVIDSYCCANQDDAIAYYNQKYPVGSGEVVVDDSDLADYTAYVESCNQKKTSEDIQRYSDVVPKEDRKYWYFTTHGIGPGTIPYGVNVLEVREGQNRKGTWGDYICLDAILNTDELQYFDLKELTPPEE